MIHDAIRPMIDNDVIADNLSVYREKGNATTVIPCVEVIFKSDVPTESNEVLDRSKVWRTQTPQTFRLDRLLWAHDEVVKRKLPSPVATCHLFSMLGETVYFSKGSEKNVKLTTMDDIEIFKALLDTHKSSWAK
jgi:2-C-methyl-D-erythritol 4-phosphate cytidylyltransferase